MVPIDMKKMKTERKRTKTGLTTVLNYTTSSGSSHCYPVFETVNRVLFVSITLCRVLKSLFRLLTQPSPPPPQLLLKVSSLCYTFCHFLCVCVFLLHPLIVKVRKFSLTVRRKGNAKTDFFFFSFLFLLCLLRFIVVFVVAAFDEREVLLHEKNKTRRKAAHPDPWESRWWQWTKIQGERNIFDESCLTNNKKQEKPKNQAESFFSIQRTKRIRGV